MKKLILLLTLFFFSAMSYGVTMTDGEIPLYIPQGSGTTHRAPTIIPVTCYLIESLNSVALFSSSLTTTAEVEISNLSTGESFSYDNVYISSVPTSLSLSGSGEYAIEITLASGCVYLGDFNI